MCLIKFYIDSQFAFNLLFLENPTFKMAKIQYGPKEKVGFQVFGYFRFFIKPELVH